MIRGRDGATPALLHLASVGIVVEAVIADHDLPFIRNMGGYTSDKLQIVHPLFLGLALLFFPRSSFWCKDCEYGEHCSA